jgi:hypothetical protein
MEQAGSMPFSQKTATGTAEITCPPIQLKLRPKFHIKQL